MRRDEAHSLCAEARSEADTCSNDLRGTCKVVVQRNSGMIQGAPSEQPFFRDAASISSCVCAHPHPLMLGYKQRSADF